MPWSIVGTKIEPPNIQTNLSPNYPPLHDSQDSHWEVRPGLYHSIRPTSIRNIRNWWGNHNMEISWNRGTQIIHFCRIVPYKPSIWGYPHFRKPPWKQKLCILSPIELHTVPNKDSPFVQVVRHIMTIFLVTTSITPYSWLVLHHFLNSHQCLYHVIQSSSYSHTVIHPIMILLRSIIIMPCYLFIYIYIYTPMLMLCLYHLILNS